jgi:hypothetical protein
VHSSQQFDDQPQLWQNLSGRDPGAGMPRNITIFALAQTLFVVLGFFGLGIVMKMNGYPSEDFGIRWNPLALFLRRHGMILLLVPLVWTICAAISQDGRRLILSFPGWAALGVVFSIAIISLFLYACANPFYRPIWLAH